MSVIAEAIFAFFLSIAHAPTSAYAISDFLGHLWGHYFAPPIYNNSISSATATTCDNNDDDDDDDHEFRLNSSLFVW